MYKGSATGRTWNLIQGKGHTAGQTLGVSQMRREAQPSGHGSGLPSTSSLLLAAKQSDKDMKVEGPV